MRPHGQGGPGVGGAPEGDHFARLVQAERPGLLGQPGRGDAARLAHAQLVRLQHLVQGHQAVERAEHHHGAALGGQGVRRAAARPVVPAHVQLPGRGGLGLLGAAAGDDDHAGGYFLEGRRRGGLLGGVGQVLGQAPGAPGRGLGNRLAGGAGGLEAAGVLAVVEVGSGVHTHVGQGGADVLVPAVRPPAHAGGAHAHDPAAVGVAGAGAGGELRQVLHVHAGLHDAGAGDQAGDGAPQLRVWSLGGLLRAVGCGGRGHVGLLVVVLGGALP
ncbi:hypothetical protein QMY38_00705 [Streptomyces sp. KAU_LT]|nr:hypothetical protein [Streptomyces sp. KAU_LT]MDI9829728.1 hypothetical protein [Streptomyces sp. KAU_LT]